MHIQREEELQLFVHLEILIDDDDAVKLICAADSEYLIPESNSFEFNNRTDGWSLRSHSISGPLCDTVFTVRLNTL